MSDPTVSSLLRYVYSAKYVWGKLHICFSETDNMYNVISIIYDVCGWVLATLHLLILGTCYAVHINASSL